MANIIPTFPSLPGLGYSVTRAPIQSVIKQDPVSGRHMRFSLWSYPQYRYTLTFNFLRNTTAEFQTLLAFYNMMYGSAGLFQFLDPDDNSATNAAIAIGDGTTTNFQLYRYLGQSPYEWADPVFAVTGTPTFTAGGSPVPAVSVSQSGVASFPFAPSPGSFVEWSGTFNWYCRFDADTLEFEKWMSTFYRMKQLVFTTEKLIQ